MNTQKIFTSILLSASLFCAAKTTAQTTVELNITHKLNGADFAFNNATQNDIGNDFSVNRLEYYISKISIKHDGGMVTPVPNHYILANGSQNVADELGSFNITNVESISFHIGVETPINHEDPSLQPPGHPLAPKSPSMHWGWTSGYRFVAIEGKSGASLGQIFEIHALGDQHYFETTVPVSGTMKNGKLIIALNADYVKALNGIDISAGIVAHGDGTFEANLLANFRDHVFSAGFPLSVQNTVAANTGIDIYPNPALNGHFSIMPRNAGGKITVRVTDIQGRLLKTTEANDNAAIPMHIENAGMYFITATSGNGSQSVTKVVVQ